MASDVERLWRSIGMNKGGVNAKVKFVALTLGPVPQQWIDEYRKYHGITFPIMNGEQVAKAFGVAFVPAIVVRSPHTEKAYIKTGQQSFERMYEFVRTVQGLSPELTDWHKKLMITPIGEEDKKRIKEGTFFEDKKELIKKERSRGGPQLIKASQRKRSVQRF